MSKQLNNRKKVLQIFLQNPTYSHSKIAKLSKVAKSSVGDILRRYKETQTIERKRGGGRKKGFVDKNKVNSIIRKEIHANPKEISPKSSNAVVSLSKKYSRARV